PSRSDAALPSAQAAIGPASTTCAPRFGRRAVDAHEQSSGRVRSVRIGAGLLSVAMSLKTVGLVAGLFVVAPSAGSAVALLREATLVSTMLAGAAALLMAIGVGLLAGTRGSRLVAMGVGVADALIIQASHVARLLHRGPADLRVPLSLVEIGLEVVLATCIGVL